MKTVLLNKNKVLKFQCVVYHKAAFRISVKNKDSKKKAEIDLHRSSLAQRTH